MEAVGYSYAMQVTGDQALLKPSCATRVVV
jgi:hypothetical protein